MKRFLIVSLALSAGLLVQAKTCIWTGGGTEHNDGLYWSDASNWQSGNVPVSGDSVYITNTASQICLNEIRGLTLSHFTYHSKGTSASINMYQRVKLTSADNIISTDTFIYIYPMLELAEGAKVTFCGTKGMHMARDDMFTGAGMVDIDMDGDFYFAKRSPNFAGTINILKGATIYLGLDNEVGADKARINVYKGLNCTDAAHTMYGEYHFYNKAGVMSQRMTTFKGDVYLHANANGDIFMFQPFGRTIVSGKQLDAGFVFDGDLYAVNDDKQANLTYYTYGGHHDSIITYNGEAHMGKNSSGVGTAISVSYQEGGTGCVVTVNKKMEATGATYLLKFVNGARLYTGAPNVLPTCAPLFGDNSSAIYGAMLDIRGYDQKVGTPLNQCKGDYVKDITFTSTGRPGTLSIGVSGAGSDRVFYPKFNDKMSVIFEKASLNVPGTSITFAQDGTTEGWFATLGVGFNFKDVSFPNLAGVSITESAPLYFQATAMINPELEIDITDSTATGPVRVATGKNQAVKRVLLGNVDVPAGVYCRTGAGVAGATEAAWMGYSGTAANYNGTITVAAHDPIAVWTGKGSKMTFLDAANWGGNVAPDLTNPNLTVTFKNAAGQADEVVPLDGTVAPAGSFVDSPYSKGAVTFGGPGTLELGGADDDLNLVFTDSASLTWNGPGTLRLTGKSTSTGTLTVNSGKVVLDYAGWTGKIVVAAGAELVVNKTCGSEVFGATENNVCAINLHGRLALEDGVTATVKELYIEGVLARHGKTYGSDASAAEKKDVLHFGGTGTILSQMKSGLMIVFH